jgi:hypothetical protein
MVYITGVKTLFCWYMYSLQTQARAKCHKRSIKALWPTTDSAVELKGHMHTAVGLHVHYVAWLRLSVTQMRGRATVTGVHLHVSTILCNIYSRVGSEDRKPSCWQFLLLCAPLGPFREFPVKMCTLRLPYKTSHRLRRDFAGFFFCNSCLGVTNIVWFFHMGHDDSLRRPFAVFAQLSVATPMVTTFANDSSPVAGAPFCAPQVHFHLVMWEERDHMFLFWLWIEIWK